MSILTSKIQLCTHLLQGENVLKKFLPWNCHGEGVHAGVEGGIVEEGTDVSVDLRDVVVLHFASVQRFSKRFQRSRPPESLDVWEGVFLHLENVGHNLHLPSLFPLI